MKTTLVLSVLCAVMAVAASISCGTCADDELCASDTTCQCNNSLYSNTGSLPSPTYTCTGAKFNIQVSKCWLETNGYNTFDIRLNSSNSECRAGREVVDGTSEMTLHRPLITSDCNTEAVVNSSHATYTNHLYIFAIKFSDSIRDDFVMDISCSEPLNLNASPNVTLGPAAKNGLIADVSYTVYMTAYKDNQFITQLSDSDTLYVGDTIYIAVGIPDLDANTFHLKVASIYASPANPSSSKYYFLQDGCPSGNISADDLTVKSNGVGAESRFAMKVFRISGSYTAYLYAKVVLCISNCITNCSSQSRSQITQPIAGRASIFLDAADYDYNFRTSSASGFSMPWTLSALIFSWILMKLT
ncbi:uromodulin-like [Lithobates pipiens]